MWSFKSKGRSAFFIARVIFETIAYSSGFIRPKEAKPRQANWRQAGENAVQQREMPLMRDMSVQTKTDAPVQLVSQCRNYREAIALCIHLGRFTQGQIASRLGIDEGTFCHILRRGGSEKRKRYLDPDLFGAIEDICGNRAISQYYDMQSRGLLNRQNKNDRIAALRRELAELEANPELASMVG